MNIAKEHISDEILNAYIDGELGPEDTAHVDAAMLEDEILSKRVNDLRQVSALMRTAFPENNLAPSETSARFGRSFNDGVWRVAATVAFVSIGVLFSWHLYEHQQTSKIPQATLAATVMPSGVENDDVASTETFKIMFHVGRENATLLNNVLGETDRLLSHSTEFDRPISVRVIASHGGLSFFNAASEGNARRIREIKQRYQGQVDFVGCGETLRQWTTKNPNKKPDLLPEMLMVDSGVLELLRLQQKGWTLVSI